MLLLAIPFVTAGSAGVSRVGVPAIAAPSHASCTHRKKLRQHARALSDVREVLFIRHGQSLANVAVDSNAYDASSSRYADAPLTDLGRSQASAWEEIAPSWEVEEVLCSPLIRAIETSACIFSQTHETPIRIIPYACEGWWEEACNRGRSSLEAVMTGTATGAVGEAKRWPALSELGIEDRLLGLETVFSETVCRKVLDPHGETELATGGPWGEGVLDPRWEANVLQNQILVSPARRIAVVCHWGVIDKLFEVDSPNCGVLRTWWWKDADGAVRSAKASSMPIPPPSQGFEGEGI